MGSDLWIDLLWRDVMRLATLALCFAALQPTLTRAAALDAADEQILKDAHVEATAPALMTFVRQRTPPGPEKARLQEEALHLADKDAGVADRAAGQMLGYGPIAIPVLRQVANDLDHPEAAERARKALQLLEGSAGTNVTVAVVRSLGTLHPEGTVEALIAFVPHAEEEEVVREVEMALARNSTREGKLDTNLVAALKDPIPVRRMVAAGALCHSSVSSRFTLVRPLLKDERPSVRLEVALALVNAHDAEAMPVLIDLLSELPTAQRKQLEEFLTELAGDWTIGVPKGEDPTARRLRRNLWLAWWNSLEPARLLDEVRSRTPSDADRARALELLAKLDTPDAGVRQRVSADLLALSPKIVPLLRQARSNPRIEAEANRCLQAVNPDQATPLPPVAPRLLALRQPPGSVEALLAYLPYAEDEGMSQEVRTLIAEIGCADGKADAALVKGLSDVVPVRRGAAAAALCQGEAREHLPAVRALLKDPDAAVRLRAALGLAALREKEAMPVLIRLLPEVPQEGALEVEDFLLRIAGASAPAVSVSGSAEERARATEAWSAWWKEAGDKIDLSPAVISLRSLGYLLAIEPVGRTGRVSEFDAGGKIRWQIEGLLYPIDAEVIAGDHVLIAELNASRVTERDFKGTIVWEKAVAQPMKVQRLANGHTFIAGRQILVEVDRFGKEVFSQNRANDNLVAAYKYRDGTIGLLNFQGIFTRLDSKGKELKSMRLGLNLTFGINGAQLTPTNTVVLAVAGLNKVSEHDLESGKMLWEVTTQQPTAATKLASGNTLIVSQPFNRMVEVDRMGKVLSEKQMPVRAIRISRR
jgi:HEAT repeat protein